MSEPTREQLLEEIAALRQRVAELDTPQAGEQPERRARSNGGKRAKSAATVTPKTRASVARISQALEHRSAELQTLLDIIPVAIGIAEDPQCRSIRINKAFASLLGISVDKNASMTAPDGEAPKSFKIWKDGAEVRPEELPMQVAAATGVEVADWEEEVVWNDGTRFHLVAHAVPLFDENGAVRGSVGVFVDMTERKRLETHLLQAQKMESVGRLAGGIAHDFNNLLTVILGYIEMVQQEVPEDSTLAAYCQNIRAAADRTAHITRQLLGFARKQLVVTKVVDVNEQIKEIDSLLRRLIGEDVELITQPNADAGMVKVDPGQFGQVLINLALNARDAMPGGGVLTVQTAPVTLSAGNVRPHLDAHPGDYVVISVTDTGAGIAPEVMAHLFEPFFTTKAVGEGTGLGLASCYGMVQQMGGFIEAENAVGQGATFKIYLPRIPEPTAPKLPGEMLESGPRGTETILIAEDEPLFFSVRQRSSLSC